MHEGNAQLAAAPTPVEQHIPSVKVMTESGIVAVPSDSEANAAASRLLGARLRELMLGQIEIMKKRRWIPPEDLKDFISAVAKVEEINRHAYAPPLNFNQTPADNTAAAMMRGAVEGLVAAASGVKPDRMERMKRIGKMKPPANIVDVKPSPDGIVEVS